MLTVFQKQIETMGKHDIEIKYIGVLPTTTNLITLVQLIQRKCKVVVKTKDEDAPDGAT